MTSAADIVASINTSTVDGHNLLALLLRLADGDAWCEYGGSTYLAVRALELGTASALVVAGGGDVEHDLTPLGREVAELLRPPPWTVTTNRGFPRLIKPNGDFACEAAGELDLCRRIAALLTADDLREAKTYRSEPT